MVCDHDGHGSTGKGALPIDDLHVVENYAASRRPAEVREGEKKQGQQPEEKSVGQGLTHP